MRTGDGFLCVYSITLQASFDEAINLHEHILRVKDADSVPFVLVGNKCDLQDDREVPTDRGQSLAKDLECPFLEASAKTRTHVVESFEALVREIKKSRVKVGADKPADGEKAKGGQKTGGRRRGLCSVL